MYVYIYVSIGRYITSTSVNKRDDILLGVAAFSEEWLPEALALRDIALHMDISKWYTSVRTLSGILLKYSGVQAAKDRNLTYREALAKHRRGEQCVCFGLLLLVIIIIVILIIYYASK